MNQRRILNNLLQLAVLLVVGCTTSKTGQKLNKGGEFDFNPVFQFSHINADTTGLYLRFNSDELLYMRSHEASEFVANVRVKLIQTLQSKTDTFTFELHPPQQQELGYWEKEIRLYQPVVSTESSPCSYQLEIQDLNRNVSNVYTERVTKNPSPSVYDLHLFSQRTKMRITTPLGSIHGLLKGDTIEMKLPRFPLDSSLRIRFSELKELPSLPPPAFSNNTPSIPDTTDFVKLEASFQDGSFFFSVPTHALMIQDETNALYFLSSHGEFPYTTQFKDLVGPMRYIMSKSEYEQLSTSPDPYTYFCNFWRDCGGSDEKAKQLIAIYYQRVTTANQSYAALVPGWRTDRGMIYTIYGKPTRIESNNSTERWQYGDENLPGSFAFVFRRKEHPYSNKIFILNRDALYRNSWESAVNSWRSGRVYRE